MTDLIAELAEVVRLLEIHPDSIGPYSLEACRDYIRDNHTTLTRIIESEATLSANYEALVIRLGEVTTELEAAKNDVFKWQGIAELSHGEMAEQLEKAERDARGKRGETWEVWQEDMPVAVSDSLPDAAHYLAMYQQDGPVTLKRAVVYRETITPEQLAAMRESAREDSNG